MKSEIKTEEALRLDGTEPPAELLRELNAKFEREHPDRILEWGYRQFGNKMVLGTGFGSSGVVLIHRISELGLDIPVFYLDTQLLFGETYELREKLEKRLNVDITAVHPSLTVEEQAEEHGEELWKSNPNKCCYIRKVLPLRKYLKNKSAWITGIRRGQSRSRRGTQIIEWDPANKVIKFNPLATWTQDQVWEYIHQYDLPYNPLHDQGYPSIGCIPCTEPVGSEDDERAGRWKNMDKEECGIHVYSQDHKNGSGVNGTTGDRQAS